VTPNTLVEDSKNLSDNRTAFSAVGDHCFLASNNAATPPFLKRSAGKLCLPYVESQRANIKWFLPREFGHWGRRFLAKASLEILP